MKSLCVIVAVTVAFSLMSPVSITLAPHSEETVLLELNVCQPDGPASPEYGNLQAICADLCAIGVPEVCHASYPDERFFYVRHFPREKDRPPEV